MSGSSPTPDEERHDVPQVDDGPSQTSPLPDETRKATVALTAAETYSTNPTLLHPRPLPSLPSPPPLLNYPHEAEDTRIIDNRDPAFTPAQPLSNPRTRQPRASLDEGDRTSSGFSDSDLLYASAPSSPLRVSTEYNGETEDATPFRKGVPFHELLERSVVDDFRPSGASRFSATMNDSDAGASTQRPAATQIQLDRHNPPSSTTDEISPVSMGLSEGHKTYVRNMLALSGDTPGFSTSDVQPNSSVFRDVQDLLPTPGSRNGSEKSPLEGSSIALSSPGNSSSSAENAQVHNSIYLSMPEPHMHSLIAGTGLQFEPLRSHSVATFSQPSTPSAAPSNGSSHSHSRRPFPSLTSPYSSSRYNQGFRGAGVTSSGSLGFPRIPRYLSYPGIPPGAAAPTPPGSLSSTDLPRRLSQDSGVNSSRLASPSPPSSNDKHAVHPLDSNVIATISKFGASTNIAARSESRPVTPSRNAKQTAPAPEVSLQQPRHVLDANTAHVGETGAVHDHQNVSRSNHPTVPPKIAVTEPNAKEEEDTHGAGGKKLVHDDNSTQTTRNQSQSPATQRSTKFGSPEHRISSQSKSNKLPYASEPPSAPKLSSPPRSSPKLPSNHSLSEITHTPAEKKAQYNEIPSSARSQYMNMLLALDDIPIMYNLAASFFTWILLAGFVLFPGTFTSLETMNLGNGLGAALVNRIVNLPVFIVAFICTGIGIIGMVYLSWKCMRNYIWLVNKIFLPGFMNALAGVISTIVNVYGVQHGEFNTTSIITISVTGGTGLVLGIFTLWYGVFLLGLVKKRHAKELEVEKADKHGNGAYNGVREEAEKRDEEK